MIVDISALLQEEEEPKKPAAKKQKAADGSAVDVSAANGSRTIFMKNLAWSADEVGAPTSHPAPPTPHPHIRTGHGHPPPLYPYHTHTHSHTPVCCPRAGLPGCRAHPLQ